MASTGEEELDKFQQQVFDVVLLDVSMPGIGVLRTIEELLKLDHEAVVIMIIAAGVCHRRKDEERRITSRRVR